MKRIGMGIVGAGFVGPHHLDAVRRLGPSDLLRAARRYFSDQSRSVVLVRADLGSAEQKAAE